MLALVIVSNVLGHSLPGQKLVVNKHYFFGQGSEHRVNMHNREHCDVMQSLAGPS